MSARAREPFRFFTRQTLTVATGVQARDLRELLDGVLSVPPSVIYHHTHQFLREHQFLVPEPANDFAYWTAHVLQDEVLGERLAAVDTVSHPSLSSLRNAFVSILKDAVGAGGHDRRVPAGKEFHFLGGIRFSMPTPHEAWDLAGFADSLRKVSISSLYLHVFEARLRPPLLVNDFSRWFEEELGEKTIAAAVAKLDPYTRTLEGLRQTILDLIEKAQEAVHAPA